MRVELLTVGTEYLLGNVPDINAAESERVLADAGVTVLRHTTVPDEYEPISTAVRDGLERTRFMITAGGLGGMRDDRTKRAVADLLGRRLDLDAAVLSMLEDRCRRLGRAHIPASIRTLAEIPRGAEVLPNPVGMAPGLWVADEAGRVVVLLPGVHSEMRHMLVEEVLPRIHTHFSKRSLVVRSRAVRTTCAIDAALEEMIGPIESDIAPLTLAYLPSEDGTDLRVTAWSLPPDETEARLARAELLLQERAGPHVYGGEGTDLAAVVLGLLHARRWPVVVAESATERLLAARFAAVPVSAETFLGSTEPTPSETASEPIVRAMIAQAQQRFAAAGPLAVVAISGPTVADSPRRLGTTWLAAATPLGIRVRKRVFQGTPTEIRRRSVQGALDLLRRVILDPQVNFDVQH